MFIATGIIVFILLTLNTTVNVMKTFQATLYSDDQKTYLILDNVDVIKEGKVYLYINKNSATYIVTVCPSPESRNDSVPIEYEEGSSIFIENNQNKKIYIDVPVRQMTLFEKIIVKGGKNS